MQPYTEDFYESREEGSRRSAEAIVPMVLQLVRASHVIDVGCGVGTWLSVFRECGVEDVWGIDGHWIDKKRLKIPEERFLALDLKNPIRIDRQFDLVVSLEVAEHLPSRCAETFVDSLTRLGPVILFSAAVPFQGGTHHANEQWTDYWVKHFQDKGYLVIDCIRRKMWQNDNVKWWYAQNTVMFASRDYSESHPWVKREIQYTATSQLSVVHPENYLALIERLLAASDPRNMSLKKVLSALPISTRKALRRRVEGLLLRK